MDENWNFGGMGNFKIQFWGPGRGSESFYKSKIDFKNILDHSRPILDQISYIVILFLMEIMYFQLKSMKIKIKFKQNFDVVFL